MTKKTGFTLVELLVVVAIIGILAGLVTANVGSARAKARDAVRQSDLRSTQTAIELAIASTGNVPGLTPDGQGAGTTYTSNGSNANPDQWLPGIAPTYISHVPTDPKNDQTYFYKYVLGSANQTGAYFIEGRLETAVQRPTLASPPSDDSASLAAFTTGSFNRTNASFLRLSGGPVSP
jgi:prepilin-type N-terminal cleavage/methylation domain-containing protein